MGGGFKGHPPKALGVIGIIDKTWISRDAILFEMKLSHGSKNYTHGAAMCPLNSPPTFACFWMDISHALERFVLGMGYMATQG